MWVWFEKLRQGVATRADVEEFVEWMENRFKLVGAKEFLWLLESREGNVGIVRWRFS